MQITSRAAEFDDRMGVIVVRSDALDVDHRAGIDECGEMAPQPVPIDFAVRLVDIALIPNPDRVHFLPKLLALAHVPEKWIPVFR